MSCRVSIVRCRIKEIRDKMTTGESSPSSVISNSISVGYLIFKKFSIVFQVLLYESYFGKLKWHLLCAIATLDIRLCSIHLLSCICNAGLILKCFILQKCLCLSKCPHTPNSLIFCLHLYFSEWKRYCRTLYEQEAKLLLFHLFIYFYQKIISNIIIFHLSFAFLISLTYCLFQ